MTNLAVPVTTTGTTLESKYVYAMALLCLVLGLPIGYLLRGAPSPSAATQPISNVGQTTSAVAPSAAGEHPHGLGEMSQMAAKQAQPLLDKLKNDPENTGLLSQIAAIYFTTHQFREADTYYSREVKVEPKNVAFRNKLATSLYYGGDVDGAIAQLNQALIYEPSDANSLFNLGMIKLRGKQDPRGALAAWQQLLKSNPKLSADRRAIVLKQIAGVQTMVSGPKASPGVPTHE